MKERPIAFSSPMVEAILTGRKTMTRRVASLTISDKATKMINHLSDTTQPTFNPLWRQQGHFESLLQAWIYPHCPFGKPGDQLWVRENYFAFGSWVPDNKSKRKTSRKSYKFMEDGRLNPIFRTSTHHPVSDQLPVKTRPSKGREHIITWYLRLARFMPKKHARIWLEIINIRLERLQDITEQDAINEGIEVKEDPTAIVEKSYKIYGSKDWWDESPIASFKSLWESLHGSGSFAENPWVWVIEFKRIEKEIK